MKLQSPDFGTWMLKRWLYVFGIGACFMYMLISTDTSNRLLAGLGLLVFMQLREISFVEDIDSARVGMRASEKEGQGAKQTLPAMVQPTEMQVEAKARRDFAAWRMNEHEDYRPPWSY